MEPAKYDLYDLLEALVERTGWPSEQMRLDMLHTIAVARTVNAMGALNHLIACKHEQTEVRYVDRVTRHTVCVECGRII